MSAEDAKNCGTALLMKPLGSEGLNVDQPTDSAEFTITSRNVLLVENNS